MKFNPQIHHRESIRLKGYDSSQTGLYFMAICCQGRKCRFVKITRGEGINPSHASPQMKLNEFGQIAIGEWLKLSGRFPNFKLDVFQIMPDHIHGIIA